ncbi:MAG: methylated-DNA--[protein]-cysteine S-methyltransferase [Rhodospirillaceae bacterium]
MPQLSLHSPIGDLTLSAEDEHIVALDWGWGRDQEPTPVLQRAVAQLEDYFDGKLKTFDLPLRPDGSAFHRAVWRIMLEIPCGQVLTYGEISARLKASARAVGTACGRNPIPVIIPCHRVIGTGGLGGYSGDGGVDTKVVLLRLEGYKIDETLPLFESLE